MVRMLLTKLAMCSLLTACASKGAEPYASTPFPVAEAGRRVSIRLQVPPGGSMNLSDTYVLALAFDAETGRAAIDEYFGLHPTRSILHLRVNLLRIDGGWDEHVAFLDRVLRSAADDPKAAYVYSGAHDQAVISRLRQGGVGITDARMQVASFRLPSFGSYRLDVETVEDHPAFAGVRSKLDVTKPFGNLK